MPLGRKKMTARTARKAAGLLAAAAVTLSLVCPAAAAPVPAGTGSAELETLWADLAKDEPTASRALLKLSARPKEAVAFLKGKLKPLDRKSTRLNSSHVKISY